MCRFNLSDPGGVKSSRESAKGVNIDKVLGLCWTGLPAGWVV